MRKHLLALPLMASWTLVLSACGGGGSGSSNPSPPPVTNTLPVANAGPNQTVNAGTGVTLDGTGSSDANGTITGYTWSQTGGPAVTLSSTTTAQPTFTAPAASATTMLTFTLRVVDNNGASSDLDSVSIAVTPLVTGNVTGRIRFTRIPATNNGLNYAGGILQPARGILVLAVTPGAQADDATDAGVLGSATTGPDGTFGMNIAANTNYQIVAVAHMLRDSTLPLPRWNIIVADADVDAGTAYTSRDPATYNSGTATAVNYDIPSGHGATGAVSGTRASAPFAALDTIYQGVQLVLGAAATTEFPALVVDWAPSNPGGETYFSPAQPQVIVLSADPTEDTDEFDQHVIAHEFGHYVEFNFSRADNIGGVHGLGDKLDIRTAFGEGFGYAFGAIVLNDPLSHDTFTSSTQFQNCSPGNGGFLCSSTFNVDDNPSTSPPGAPVGNYGCWCSESSVWSILWDIYDTSSDANDTLGLGFQPIWNVLVNQQRATPAMTSIFSFINGLKTALPANAAAIDALLAAQNISNVQDAYGTGETHFPDTVPQNAALPMYTPISVGGGPVVVRNVDDAGVYNTVGNHRFLRFTLNTARTLNFTVSTSNPDSERDPDFLLYRDGELVWSGEDDFTEFPEVEQYVNAQPGTYVIDVYDCANGCGAELGVPGDYDLTVTVN
jgi:hypothetical protein